jgi:hypothetical protein
MTQPDQRLSEVFTRAAILARDLKWSDLPVQDQIAVLGGALTEVLGTLPRAEARFYCRSHIASLCNALHLSLIEVVISVLKSLVRATP